MPGRATLPDPGPEWLVDHDRLGDVHLYQRLETRVSRRTRYQHLEISRLDPLGWCLILDGDLQSAEVDEHIYHEALVHPAMLAHPAPRRVLVLGGGEGATAREALRHPSVERLVMVDLDEDVVRACREHLPSWNGGAFDDPRLQLVMEDARAYLAHGDAGEQFDVIVADLVDVVDGGEAAGLYSASFYRLAAARLAPGGAFATHASSIVAPVQPMAGRSALLALSEVFSSVAPYAVYIPSFHNVWLFAVAADQDVAAPSRKDAATAYTARGLAPRYLTPKAYRHAFTWPGLDAWRS